MRIGKRQSKRIVCSDGIQMWLTLVGEDLHREDGPAVIWPDGFKEYWLEDKRDRPEAGSLFVGTMEELNGMA